MIEFFLCRQMTLFDRNYDNTNYRGPTTVLYPYGQKDYKARAMEGMAEVFVHIDRQVRL